MLYATSSSAGASSMAGTSFLRSAATIAAASSRPKASETPATGATVITVGARSRGASTAGSGLVSGWKGCWMSSQPASAAPSAARSPAAAARRLLRHHTAHHESREEKPGQHEDIGHDRAYHGPVGRLSYFTTMSKGALLRGLAPLGVTSEVRPRVMASPLSLSRMIMWRKNTMPGSAITGLSL